MRAEHEPCVPHLVEHVGALGDDVERLASLFLGLLHVAGAEINLCERRNGLGRLLVATSSSATAKACLK